jgi:ubiquinone/menaquinone biosynthesis C-methylase UbiE
VSESVAFDQAAEYYDRTRSLPPAVVEQQAAQLDGELRGRGVVLEIGVGTGRVATTLDVPVVGLDLSRPMMDVLRTKTTVIPLIEGDATQLPLADGSVGGAYAAHVFHLIPTWPDALAELARVVRPGGVILVARASDRSEIDVELRAQTGVHRSTRGADTLDEVDRVARRIGLGVRALDPITWTAPYDVADQIAGIEQRVWSGMWELDDEAARAAADRVRAWAMERFGSTDAVVDAERRFAWHAYDVPAPS